LILDLYLIAIKTLSFISWDVVWFEVNVVGFTFQCCWCSSIFLYLICFSWEILKFYFFVMLNPFRFCILVLVCFRVNPVGSKLGQSLNPVWFAFFFFLLSFSLFLGCVWQIPLKLVLDSFYFKGNCFFLTKHGLKKIQKNKN
jgi:hypothetical protein